MASVTLKGNPVEISGNLPQAGTKAPDFVLTKTDLSDVTLKDFAGSTLVLNIFPSIDTSVCAASVRRFNVKASELNNSKVLCVSLDLPFAHKRFCEAEGIKNVITLSELRGRDFGNAYGVRMTNGPLAGLLARAVVIIDSKGNIAYTQLVPEITMEPDYEKALESLKSIA